MKIKYEKIAKSIYENQIVVAFSKKYINTPKKYAPIHNFDLFRLMITPTTFDNLFINHYKNNKSKEYFRIFRNVVFSTLEIMQILH